MDHYFRALDVRRNAIEDSSKASFQVLDLAKTLLESLKISSKETALEQRSLLEEKDKKILDLEVIDQALNFTSHNGEFYGVVSHQKTCDLMILHIPPPVASSYDEDENDNDEDDMSLDDDDDGRACGNPTFSFHKEITSSEVTHEIHDSKGCNFLSEELPDIDPFNDIHPYFDDDPLSGSITYSSNSLLEEFTNKLALITYPPDYDDNLKCDIESDLREIEFLLYQGEDSDFKDSLDQTDLANRDDLFVDPTPEMFTDEHAPDYSFPPRFDVYPDDFLETKSDADKFDDDLFDSKGEKIKEFELLIDQLDLPCDILLKYNSLNSQDFTRDDDLPSPDNEDKDFNPSFYDLLFFKDVPTSMRLLPFSSENEEKVFKPGIYTFEKVYCCFLTELSHPGYPVFKVNMILLSPMKIFYVQSGKNTPPLDVLLFHFNPPSFTLVWGN
uniref:Reverse transcriptase domain-containing protein n=1 Tax=Tanacetum cinerariifolium TaxID=118510 RepID=A0A6L2JT77_TANCI|nr:hypothetical protein [Tanacetum cinerariifolium]